MGLQEKLLAERGRQKEKAEAQGDFLSANWYTPKTGLNMIRILPHWKKPGEEMFFKEVRIHFGIDVPKDDGTGTITIPVRCLREFEKECPLCNEHENADKEGKQKMQDIRPQEKYLYNLFDIDAYIALKKSDKAKAATKEGVMGCVKAYSAPQTIHQGIFNWMDEIDDPSDFEKGRDWKIEKTVDPGKSAKTGTKYSVRPGLNSTQFPVKFRDWAIEAMINIDDLYKDDHTGPIYKAAGVPIPSTPATAPATAPAAASASTPAAAGNTGEVEASNLEDDPWGGISEAASVETPKEETTLEPKDLGINVEDDALQKELQDLGVE